MGLHLATKRLELRTFTFDDIDELASMLGDAEALTEWGPPLTRDESRSWIVRNRKRYENDGFGRCAVILRCTGELVGDCGLIRTVVQGQPEVELGWIVRRTHWGMGIATEAGAVWRDYAFESLALERIVSMVSDQNNASRRVAEKLGMTVERRAMWNDLPYLMYSVRRDQTKGAIGPVTRCQSDRTGALTARSAHRWTGRRGDAQRGWMA